MSPRLKGFLAALPLRIACAAGIWYCYRIALADRLGREQTEESLRAAIEVRPNHYLYHWQLGQVPSPDSRRLLERAIELNPYNAGPMVDLATSLELGGDPAGAERLLLRANEVDRTYFPKWSLANFYFRQERPDDFWKWARRAAEVGSEDMSALFSLAHRLESAPAAVSRDLVPDRKAAVGSYIHYLLRVRKDVPLELAVRAIPLLRAGEDSVLWDAAEQMLGQGRYDDLSQFWERAAQAGRVATGEGLQQLGRKTVQTALDWRVFQNHDVFPTPGPAGVEIILGGAHGENLLLLERKVLVEPLSRYEVVCVGEAIDFNRATGLRWRVVAAGREVNGPSIAQGTFNQRFEFRAEPGERLVSLQLVAIRETGSIKPKGTVRLVSAGLVPSGTGGTER